MELNKYFHVTRLMSDFHTMSTRDMMKYALINDEEICKAGVSDMVLKVLINKYLELSPPMIDSESN